MARSAQSGARSHGPLRWLRRLLLALLAVAGAFYLLCAVALFVLRWVDPPTTAVQAQRRIEALLTRKPYRKLYHPIPEAQMAPALPHAVIAAEDTRFYLHHGIDWQVVDELVEQDLDEGRVTRGGSTITQQLVKNLFLTTSRSFLRKGLEFTLVPLAELILGKRRILELYLNVIEWGPGVYGADSAAQFHYRLPAARLGREQATRLAAIIPNPRRRRPARMTNYSAIIDKRMLQMGW